MLLVARERYSHVLLLRHVQMLWIPCGRLTEKQGKNADGRGLVEIRYKKKTLKKLLVFLRCSHVHSKGACHQCFLFKYRNEKWKYRMPSCCSLNCIDWQQRHPFLFWAQHKKPYITSINKPKSAVTFNRWKITVAVILTWYTCCEVSSISLHKVQRSSNINVHRAMGENTHLCLTHNVFEHGSKMTNTAEVPHI